MSKIVELKIGEIQNVVGGVNAVSVNLTATASAHRAPGGTSSNPPPHLPLPGGTSGTMNAPKLI